MFAHLISRRWAIRRSRLVVVFAVLVGSLALVLVATGQPTLSTAIPPPADSAPADLARKKPNIVYFLVDDMSAELMNYVDTIGGLASGGTTFTNYFVSNSLCCPSRASTFTGEFPHNTGVKTNKGTDEGGYAAFKKHENRTYATALRSAKYRTGYLGKYINEYSPADDPVPPGWSEWHVATGGGYSEYNYRLTNYIAESGGGKNIGKSDGTYLVDKLSERATGFLDRSRKHAPGQPFFLQVAPFSPHDRVKQDPTGKEPFFPPAMRDRPKSSWPGGQYPNGDCGGRNCDDIDVTKLPAFNENVDDKPAWLKNREPIQDPPGCQRDPNDKNKCLKSELRSDFRNRIRMMQSLDDSVASILAALTPAEKANTYFVFGSDNGFHLGQHRLPRGKSTAYDTDIRVPLVVKRPNDNRGTVVNNQLVQNVDIYATFVDIANGGQAGPADRDGRSLLPLIHGQLPGDWRTAALVEHQRPNPTAAGLPDPDHESLAAGGVPTYNAIRTANQLFVRYSNGATEFYDLATDPHQQTNKPKDPYAPKLAGPLRKLVDCRTDGETPAGCWKAGQLG